MPSHGFWFAVVMTVVVWYSSITVYVAIRGALDIRQMLRNLSAQHRRKQETTAVAKP